MKTKIIYISGDEVFDMADIRAAFEEVRGTLNLGADTVLFGVPVDADDALATTTNAPIAATTIPQPEVVVETPIEVPAETTTEPAMDTVHEIEPAAAPELDESAEEPAPVQKKTRGRPRAAKKVEDEAPVLSDTPAQDTEKVIPILSILATKSEEEAAPVAVPTEEIQPEENTTAEDEDIPETVAGTVMEAIEDEIEEAAPVVEKIETTVIESVTIEDVIVDDAPTETPEKTLEELLESMTPLREDIIGEDDFIPTADDEDDAPAAESDTDATLEQLATEFADNQDKIVPLTKAESQGKIGKLKNILPFKKVKRDDSGIMGDLFGWAGIAANDEEFSMPGFFTAAKK